MIFWDTSALVRCFATGEPGYERARNLLLGDRNPHACTLIRAEAVGAIARGLRPDRRRAEAVLGTLESTLKHFTFVPVDDRLLEAAVRIIRKHLLRGADGVHLSAALMLRRELGRRHFRFATGDLEQAGAAREEGLRVIEPV